MSGNFRLFFQSRAPDGGWDTSDDLFYRLTDDQLRLLALVLTGKTPAEFHALGPCQQSEAADADSGPEPGFTSDNSRLVFQRREAGGPWTVVDNLRALITEDDWEHVIRALTGKTAAEFEATGAGDLPAPPEPAGSIKIGFSRRRQDGSWEFIRPLEDWENVRIVLSLAGVDEEQFYALSEADQMEIAAAIATGPALSLAPLPTTTH